ERTTAKNGREPDTGSPGRSAKARGRHWPEGSTPSPSAGSCPGGETESSRASNAGFQVRILAGVLGLRISDCGLRIEDDESGRLQSAIRNRQSAIDLIPWPSGDGASPTRRRSVVRVHPGSLPPRGDRRSPWCSGFARDSVTVAVAGSTPP